MSIADDLTALEQLHQRGSLNDTEFAQAKARLLQGVSAHASMPVGGINHLRRSLNDRWIGGVCGGLAVITGLESWVWRVLFVLTLMLGGFGLVAYLLMWVFVPMEYAALGYQPALKEKS